jgi:predicted RNA-binding protein YlxR (DUF448 family)
MTSRPTLRTCVGCRRLAEQRVLVRLVAAGDGDILVSPPPGQGRGAYLCPSMACLAAAWKRRSLPRAFRRATPAATETTLRARFALELARRGLGGEGTDDQRTGQAE